MKASIIILIGLFCGLAVCAIALPVDLVFLPNSAWEDEKVQKVAEKLTAFVFGKTNTAMENVGWIDCTLGGTNGKAYWCTRKLTKKRVTKAMADTWTERYEAQYGFRIWTELDRYEDSGIVASNDMNTVSEPCPHQYQTTTTK